MVKNTGKFNAMLLENEKELKIMHTGQSLVATLSNGLTMVWISGYNFPKQDSRQTIKRLDL